VYWIHEIGFWFLIVMIGLGYGITIWAAVVYEHRRGKGKGF
jgi:hypothetical protein